MENVNFGRPVDNSFINLETASSSQPKKTDNALFDDWSTRAADAIGLAFNDMDNFLLTFKETNYNK